MKKGIKFLTIMSVIIMSAYLVTGCGDGSYESLVGEGAASGKMDTVSVKKDGSIEQKIIDQFEMDYYDINELAAKAQEKIDGYTDEEGDIILQSAEDNNGNIVVKLIYKSGEYYEQYNNREFFYGTVSEASAQGYSVKNVYGEDGAKLSDTKEIWDNHVVIIQTKIDEKIDVNVFDKILYTSDNIVKAGNNDVIIETKGSDMISCIVFK
ncbi:MAG: hypothetical protein NC433_16220 [Clostridiales bacterium]|nr:hypothetical protein [Clostridiales bacterium]